MWGSECIRSWLRTRTGRLWALCPAGLARFRTCVAMPQPGVCVCVCVCVCPSSPPNQHPVFMLQWFLRIMSIIQLKLAVVHDLSLNSLGWSQNAFYLGLRGGSLVHQGQLCIALKKKHLFLKKNRKPSLEDSIITRWLATWLSGWLLLVAILVMVYR